MKDLKKHLDKLKDHLINKDLKIPGLPFKIVLKEMNVCTLDTGFYTFDMGFWIHRELLGWSTTLQIQWYFETYYSISMHFSGIPVYTENEIIIKFRGQSNI